MKLGITVSAIALSAGMPAIAQTADLPSPAEAPGLEAEEGARGKEIVVTGSRIRGTGPVGSNVVSVSAAEIEAQPTATITEFLRKVPQIQGFGVDSSSAVVSGGQGGTNTTRGSAINLRGVGPSATLTLVDGQRLSFSGVSSNYVDANAIPAAAVDRIEIVPDGASAVYGSDAVAGVVNFILRKEFEGIQVRGRYGVADDYWLAQASFMAGTNWGSGGVVFAYEYTRNDALGGDERDFVRFDLTGRGGRDYRNGQCSPGNIVVAGRTYAIPQAGVTPATAGQLVAGTRNLCENLSIADILPEEERHKFYGYAYQEIGDRLRVHVQGIYSLRDYTAQAIQQGSTSNIVNLAVPNTNPFFVRPVGTTATTVTVEYDFTPLIGPIQQTGFTDTLFLTAGLAWNIDDNWKVSLDGVFSEDRSAQNTRRINTTVLTDRLRSTNPALAFNPFGGANSADNIAAIYSGVFNPFAISRTRGGSLQADGSLFSIAGGDVRLAVGAEFLRYTSDAGNAQGALAAPTVTINPKLERNQKSAFAELYIPIFSSANATGMFERLDLSAAVRYDDYSDVGSTTNPKFGLNWSPARGVLFKASYGTSFRAPGLQDLPLLRTGAGLTTWTDPLSPTGTSVGLQLNAGNPNLSPESAETWSISAELNPGLVPGLRLAATYFNLLYKDLIGFPPRTTSSLLDPNYAFAVTRNPTAAQITALTSQGLSLQGVVPPVIAFLYDGSAQNLGSIHTDGFDFDASYAFDAAGGELTLGFNGTYTLGYDFAVTQIARPLDRAGDISFPVVFRARAYAGFRSGGFTVNALVNHVSGYTNTLVAPEQNVGSWNPVDIDISYEFKNSGVLNGLALGLSVTNLFDQDPPFVNIPGGWDPGQASALGRLVAFTLTKKF
ncbi:MAG: TonB-dependent receptor plug domain-containing protein [Blastomonas fulva]